MTHPEAPALAFDACVHYLRRRLAESLPGTAAQLAMAPAYRQNPRLARIEGKPCCDAAVLALFFPVDDTPTLLLTVRHADLTHHAGQVSFPGGARDPGETLRETALREAQEEVGVVPEEVEVLGSLTPLYIPPSNYCVYPFVGATASPPALRPRDEEVDAVLQAPLPLLLEPQTLRREPWTLHGQTVEVPFLDVGGYKIWGATAMMLSELLALFRST